jgi:pimeloyl-ACP methyl ester carboxylesterase
MRNPAIARRDRREVRFDPLESIEGLPQRFSPRNSDPADGRYRLKVSETTRDVVVQGTACRIEAPSGKADVEIATDAATWHRIDSGKLSGIEAFAEQRLSVKGSIERSLHFEPMFERRRGGGLEYKMRRVEAGGLRWAVLDAGPADAEPLILLHGLGATKASFLTVIPELSRHYRVLAVDLPGFGSSSKPLGRYDAPWFADHVFGLMDGLGLESAFLAGNSMGGRIAMEMAMKRPERTTAIACLCPAAAFSYRPGLMLVRLLRPELGLLASRLPRSRLRSGLREMFADPSCLEEQWYEVAVDDFLSTWKSPRARLAFFAAARSIFLDEPDGDDGFWARLAAMKVPALYIYGRHDTLVTSRFGDKVRRFLPDADVEVWDDCGHIPQMEHPARTAASLTEFFASNAKSDLAV